MSYADVASQNAPPQSEQPHPNPLLAEGANKVDEAASALPDVNSSKVNVVPSDSDLEHLKTQASADADKAQARIEREAQSAKDEAKKLASSAEKEGKKFLNSAEKEGKRLADSAEKEAKRAEKKISRAAKEGSEKAAKAWDTFSSEPAYWASTLGAVNVALLGGLGIFAYIHRDQAKSWDRRYVTAGAVGILTLLGGQSYFATEAAKKQKGGLRK